ncbi:hypothetical protein ASD21_21190 [Caulobacter sp. Root1455]|uniref:hypothetical protein n=1 Tax=unclassified Caulobacter TaxID=2648921 RepID=UPI0006FF00B8|nr:MULTISPECIES: hypothetical protein [unclassified Caulobacter]KQY35054.1 hypothetical protein ASD38_00320 [Caulobacter sp. Root487D2Y]KQZ02836.1 hypothetical protein ASD21_21190 [Caulobacter sp. Root1455]
MPTDLEHHGPTLNATRARQGRWGKHVFWVLILSTVLAAAALFGAWGLRSGDLAGVEHTKGATTTQEAEHYSTEQAPVKQTPAG